METDLIPRMALEEDIDRPRCLSMDLDILLSCVHRPIQKQRSLI